MGEVTGTQLDVVVGLMLFCIRKLQDGVMQMADKIDHVVRKQNWNKNQKK